MQDITHGVLDEAYERFAATGPEFVGWLSNHGPMAAEAMVRAGHDARVHAWIDAYSQRLEARPVGNAAIDNRNWQAALGDPKRLGDWLTYFERATSEAPWRDILRTWWPRLLPGIAAGATHGVIRVGHAVRALGDSDADTRVRELAQGLGYWAARWQAIPDVAAPAGDHAPGRALAGIPLIPSQRGGIVDRLNQLHQVRDWPAALASGSVAATPDAAEANLTQLVDAATFAYLERGHGNGIMLVHAATAPNAVLRSLPALPRELWIPSWNAAWSASSAVIAAYAAPDRHLTSNQPSLDPAEVMSRAVAHGDEHAIKFADTAIEVHARTGDPRAVAAAVLATDLIEPVA
jgi:hypothetical protein